VLPVPKPKLTVVKEPAFTGPQPPAHLDAIGRQLWESVVSAYTFDDPGSFEILYQACCARSRAAKCAERIDQDGEMIASRTGIRAHPLLREECASRALACRLLLRLGLDLEPIGPVGRPSGR
jgi:hypothetical protein